ncbi:DNA repair protein XRCC1-like protein [Leptotrombidium deliense]|uniref:DNA repair protein XRCC1-like protein n=1 Tax=Leptotrombidium deliense TaxID=299467 RepID=A0A443RWE2_9ACAR|nr:DNA repair protein XRCC1-like protein [Leptotrombidium deliense]
MTPSESKSLSNLNRVRCFDKSKLNPSAVDKTWDQIKVICTQPFNKTIKYGLAFIKINSPSNEDEDVEETSLSSLKLGAFKVKPSTSSEGESSTVGSWFAKRDNTPTTNNNSKLVLRNTEVKKPSLAVAAGITPKRQRKETPKVTDKSPKNDKTNATNNVPTTMRKTRKVATKNVPFNRLMSKVVFVISGIQNPERAELRTKGLEMGAKYKPDWDATCTHLM